MLISTYEIIRNCSEQLVILPTKGCKSICRQYDINKDKETIQHLEKRQKLHHPSLLPLYKIQYALNSSQLLFQYYTMTLSEMLRAYKYQFQEDEIINTFQPIIQVIQYMITRNYYPRCIQSNSIVITQNQQIKFIDNFFLNKIISIQPKQLMAKQIIYQQLSCIIFEILCPKYRQAKSWKNRITYAKQTLSTKTYLWLESIFKKTLLNISNLIEPKKRNKKIKKSYNHHKCNIKHMENKIKSNNNSSSMNINQQYNSGKQNMII